jgi:hypothetical protein
MAPHLELGAVALVLLIAACLYAFAKREVTRRRRSAKHGPRTTVNIINFSR